MMSDNENDDGASEIEENLDVAEDLGVDEPRDIISEQIQERVLIKPENFQTSDIMSRFEYTQLISIRIGQLENKSPYFVDISDCATLADCAKKELFNGVLPLMISRTISSTIAEGREKIFIELRDPNKMVLPADI